MNLGIRWKFFAVSLITIIGIGLTSGLYLELNLRKQLESGIEDELLRLALIGQGSVESSLPSLSLEHSDQLCDRLGSVGSSRVTIIAKDGTVLGDSKLSVEEVRNVDNHANRPEIKLALSSGRGSSRRYSQTLDTHMLYVAVPFERQNELGVVRTAMDLSDVDESVGQLRILLLFAGLLGLAVAVFVGGLSSHLTSRRLIKLIDHAQSVSGAEAQSEHQSKGDELGRLAGSFNHLAKELDRAVENLASERDRLETILESMSDAVIALDRHEKITLINASALGFLGFEDPPIGRTLSQVVEVPELIDLVSSCSDSEGGGATEIELINGSVRRFMAQARKLRAAGGIVIVMHDVTEMRRLETVRRDFVANVSHELRTPVSVVQANAETLLDGALDDRELAVTFLDAILRNAQRLSHIITDLLDLSRMEAGRYALQPEETLLFEPVRRSIESVEKNAQSRGLTVENKVEDDVRVMADATGLEHVLLNLLDNAVKYTPKDGHVSVHTRKIGKMTRVEVRDDGPGIKPKHRKRIFERFYRVDPGRSRKMGGTGLGLSITKHLVESMGGEVGVMANDPKGSVFWFTLPSR